MKRVFCMIVTFALVLALTPSGAFAEKPLDIDAGKASAALLINVETGRVLFEKDPNLSVEAAGLRRLPALLTVCAAFDEGLLSEESTVTVADEAARIRGTTAFLSSNERIEAGSLLKAAVMLTAGDAVFALLCAAYHSEAGALEAVNERLSLLGITPVENSMGEGRLFTLTELASICMELVKSEAYLKYSSLYTDTLTHENAKPTELTNPNRLVRHYSGCFGLATGSVGASQYSAAVIAKRGSATFLALAAGLPDSASRFALITDMLDTGFASYRVVSIGSRGESFGTVNVAGGAIGSIDAVLSDEAMILLPVNDTKIIREPSLPEEVEAPLEEGAEIGRLIVKNSSDDVLAEIPLTASGAVKRASFADEFLKLARDWIHSSGEVKEDRSDSVQAP